ncbi:low molecular weight phosphotyrosine protein phosphatase [Ideonella sp. 4Y11]|uniref:protein-tyrosine-phosphatase n=1 Tax=Ideonella aquatica TaxID=2824119 RepID=A0A940YID2_9BURK|nr:low molecular weight protein-tyrosine-phosphatase [Ideonella aquatica]MBQ0958656.1 low molecular weight phosphotyrosine protein phosphatase [Ideonella aquatica]
MSAPVRVLMVCTGNICRSPTAEGVLRHLAQQAGWGRRLEVDSAGTTGYHLGEPPDERSQAHALRRGYDLSAQRARQVADEDFRRFDWILAMDRGHLRELRERAPVLVHDRIRLLLDFAPGLDGRDVPDPYYGGATGFEQVLDLVEQGCRGFLAELGRR